MLKAKFRLEGAEELRAKLRQLNYDTRKNALTDALMPGARLIHSAAYEKAPRKTGRYRESIVVNIAEATEHFAILEVGSKSPLGHLLEFGHEKVLWGRRTGGWVPAIPHLRPAFSENKDAAMRLTGQRLRWILEGV